MGQIKRSKADEQMEQMLGEIAKWAWEHKKEVALFFVLALPTSVVYLWIEKKALLTKYLPITEIEDTAMNYFPKIIFVLSFFILLMVIRVIFVEWWNKKTYKYVKVLPHSQDGVSVESLNEMIRSFHGSGRSPLSRLVFGKETLTFTIHHDDKNINFYLGCPEDRMIYLKTHLKSLYSRAEFYYPKDLRFPGEKRKKRVSWRKVFKKLKAAFSLANYKPDKLRIIFKNMLKNLWLLISSIFKRRKKGKKFVGGRMYFKFKKQKETLSLANYKSDKLPILFNNMPKNTWFQISFSSNNGYQLRKVIEKSQREAKKSTDAKSRTFTDKEELRSWDHRLSGNQVVFDVTISMATESYPGVSALKSTGSATNAMMGNVNELKYKRWRRSVKRFPRRSPYSMQWTSSELANLVHLPNLNSEKVEPFLTRISHNSPGLELLPDNVFSNPKGILFGYQYHPTIKDREVRVMLQYLGEHWALSGLNGSGKSTVLNQMLGSFNEMFLQDGISPGYTLIDPAQETAVVMLNNLLVREVWEKQAAEKEGREPRFKIDWNKVKWISFRNTKYPPALNLLHKSKDENEDLAIDQIFEIIKEYFQAAPQTERLLRACVRTLMADPEETHTILGIKPLLLNEDFRKPILQRLAKTGEYRDLLEFWRTEAEQMMDASLTPLMTRLDTFQENRFLKRVFGQKEFSFPLRKWMDEGYIILMDFAGMSEQEISLIGSYLSYMYYRIADTRPPGSNLHQLCVDEIHKVEARIFKKIVAESRKKGLSLGAIVQDIMQLPAGLLQAMSEVTGNLFVCRQGKDNAKYAASLFETSKNGKTKTTYTEGFFKDLEKRVCAIKITDKVDGVEKSYQTVIEVPPLDRYLPTGKVATYGNKKLIEESDEWTSIKANELQSIDGKHQDDVDKDINAYLYGDEEVPAEETKPKREKKSLFAPVEEENAENNEEQNEDLPFEVKTDTSDHELPPQDQEELQRALQEELAQHAMVPDSALLKEPKEKKKRKSAFE